MSRNWMVEFLRVFVNSYDDTGPDADHESPEFAKPEAPLADWMERADKIIKETK